VDDVNSFENFFNLRTFVQCFQKDKKFKSASVSEEWIKYFEKSCTTDCHSEFLKVGEFFYCFSSHAAIVERMFALMNAQ
jgi:hypothetical protein